MGILKLTNSIQSSVFVCVSIYLYLHTLRQKKKPSRVSQKWGDAVTTRNEYITWKTSKSFHICFCWLPRWDLVFILFPLFCFSLLGFFLLLFSSDVCMFEVPLTLTLFVTSRPSQLVWNSFFYFPTIFFLHCLITLLMGLYKSCTLVYKSCLMIIMYQKSYGFATDWLPI